MHAKSKKFQKPLYYLENLSTEFNLVSCERKKKLRAHYIRTLFLCTTPSEPNQLTSSSK